ncbi:MAG TPA: ROK family transcriptional regulator [Kineosporiaceae bacterium]
MAGSQTSLREANRALVIDTVRRFGGLTQVELATATGLSAATVSTIVRELLAAEVVQTRAAVRSGRRAVMVTMNRRVGLAVGVQVGLRSLEIVLADAAHEVLARQTLPLPFEHRADTTLDQVALLVVELLQRVGAEIDNLVGIGIGVPAPVDPSTGIVSLPGVMRGWDDVPIAHMISKRLGRPVFVDNDANLGALAESTLGAGRPYRDFAYVRVSHGIGAGIVIGGSVYRGFSGTAGEIGHSQVAVNGKICLCGSRGCLDTVVGSRTLVSALSVSHGLLTLRDIVKGVHDGDPGCTRVVEDAGAVIGTAVATMTLTINPECVIVGGELAETHEVLIRPIREAIRQRVMSTRITPIEVVPAELGPAAEATGALALALALAETDAAPRGAGREPRATPGEDGGPSPPPPTRGHRPRP